MGEGDRVEGRAIGAGGGAVAIAEVDDGLVDFGEGMDAPEAFGAGEIGGLVWVKAGEIIGGGEGATDFELGLEFEVDGEWSGVEGAEEEGGGVGWRGGRCGEFVGGVGSGEIFGRRRRGKERGEGWWRWELEMEPEGLASGGGATFEGVEEGDVGGFGEWDEWWVEVVFGVGDLTAEEFVEDLGESDGVSGWGGAFGEVFGAADEGLGVLFAEGRDDWGRGRVKGNDFQGKPRPPVRWEIDDVEGIDGGREFEKEGIGEGVGWWEVEIVEEIEDGGSGVEEEGDLFWEEGG